MTVEKQARAGSGWPMLFVTLVAYVAAIWGVVQGIVILATAEDAGVPAPVTGPELLVGGKEWLVGTASFALAAAPAQAVAWPETALDVDALTGAQRDALESLPVALLQRLLPVLPPDAQALLLP